MIGIGGLGHHGLVELTRVKCKLCMISVENVSRVEKAKPCALYCMHRGSSETRDGYTD